MAEPRETATATRDFVAELAEVQRTMGVLADDLPAPMQGFGDLHHAAIADGALDSKTKELIALAIGVNSRCDGCIAYHTQAALAASATREEILEALGVAIMMGGGPSVIYASHVVEALEQLVDV